MTILSRSTYADAERVERAAIWWRGHVYSVPRPGRHHDVIRKMHDLGFGPECTIHQGFTTDIGRFVDRREAAALARAADQIIRRTGNVNELFSEDMW